MKNKILVLLLILISHTAFAQSWNKNLIRVRTPQTQITTAFRLESLSSNKDSVATDIQYIDGLGRPMQSVSVSASALGNDMVTPIKYDQLGRAAMKYLPYASSTADGSYRISDVAEQSAFYSSSPSPRCATDSRPFSETIFEVSPLNRPEKQYGAGQDWYNSHPSQLTYLGNASGEVKHWIISGNTLNGDDNFTAGKLYKVQTTDENGNNSCEFKDMQDRVVLKQVENTTGTFLKTYYVYNEFGYLAYVIPPKATLDTYTEGDTGFNELLYAYHYDPLGRMTEKHIPGAGWTYMVYNNIDQLILSQDALQKAGSGTIISNTWIFTKYDALGRVVMTGSVINGDTRDNIQEAVKSETTLWETKDPNQSGQYYYTNSAYPRFADYNCLLTINYYDNYTFDREGKNFESVQGYADNSTMTQGLLTGSKVKVLDGLNTWLTNISYYDEKGRPLQTQSKKYSSNNSIWDRLINKYDFEGKVIKAQRLHNNIPILNRYIYDHAGRKKEVYQQTGNSSEVEQAEYNYNELGQLVKKYLHGNSSTHLQSIDYRYNIRGWLTSINNAGLQVGENNEHDYNVFGEELSYNSEFRAGGVGGPAQWNGNISGMNWKSKGLSVSTSSVNVNGYAFQYDKLNRLKLANYGSGVYGSSLADNAERYNEVIDYDVMGNISTLIRKGIQGTIDNLTYGYKQSGMSNQLASITDASNDPTGFKKVNNSGDDYIYDANGNLIQDKNKGLDISYNFLNLPQSINTITPSNPINYIYDATGKKLKKTFSGQPDHYYMDGIEYGGSDMLFAMTEEGRVRPKTGGYSYDYFLKDHLGNIRVVLNSEPPSPYPTAYPTATMEDGNADNENLYYANLDATRDAKPSGFDSEWDNQNVARLTSSDPSRQTGPSITLKVNSGDKLNLSVKSFYQSYGADYGRNALGATALGQLVSALLSPMALTGSSLGAATDLINSNAFGSGSNFQNMVGSLPGSNYNNPPDYTPKAYLVWMLFDSEFNLVKTGNSSGVMQVPTGADQMHPMVQTGITMDKGGFFYAYVVNESVMNVYFDNFQVSTTSSPVLEENNYYPFGMLNAQLSAPGITDPINNYKYNGKELQKELSLEWLDYGARFYDPQIGRFTTIDPKAELDRRVTPFAYVFDNPMRFIDPDGMSGDEPWYIRAAKAVSNFFKGSSTGLNQRYQTEPGRGATVTGIRDTKGGRVSNSTGKPVGEWGVRVDNAHSGTPTPHINVNEKISGVPDPHTPISATTLKGLENTGKTLDAIDRVAVPFAIATDATRLGVAFHQDGNIIGDNTKITSGSVAVGWAGAIVLGGAGAKIGAGIGTLIEPGGGTVIGGFFGGIIGGVIGGFGGSAAGENIVKNVIEK